MKKFLALLLLVCLLPLCALAEMDEDGNVVVTLDGAEIFFTPMEGYCLTRETSASTFIRLGISQREIVAWMEENWVYALLLDQQGSMEIQIQAGPTTEMDFDDLDLYGLKSACDVIRSLYVTQGYKVESAERCHTLNGHSYVKTVAYYPYEDGAADYVVEYYTCQSGYEVYVRLFPYQGAPTEEQIYLCEGVVDSLWVSETASGAANE